MRVGKFCGGYIDPVTLKVMGYVQLNNQTASGVKGFICPLGQTCMVCCHYSLTESLAHPVCRRGAIPTMALKVLT